jgi:hypothetical protein
MSTGFESSIAFKTNVELNVHHEGFAIGSKGYIIGWI